MTNNSYSLQFNAAIIGFGQSDAGKTHTLIGTEGGLLQQAYAKAAFYMQVHCQLHYGCSELLNHPYLQTKQQKAGAALRPPTIKLQVWHAWMAQWFKTMD